MRWLAGSGAVERLLRVYMNAATIAAVITAVTTSAPGPIPGSAAAGVARGDLLAGVDCVTVGRGCSFEK
jgi:hypothetical protein